MIATYIQELLKKNNRVILPDFGAFLVRATSQHKDSEDLALKLPDIYFSPFLKFNDELMVKYIIEKEKVTKDEATEKIKSFIEEVRQELNSEKPFVFENFGQFIEDKQGKVIFEPAENVATTPEKKEEEKKPAKAEKKPAAKTKAEPKKETKAAPEAKKEEKKTKLEEFKPEEKPKEEKKEAPKVEKEAKTVTEVKKEEKPKATPVKPKAKVSSYKKEQQGLNKGVIWTIAIVVPIAAILVLFLINFEKFFSQDDAQNVKAKQENVKQDESAAVDETPEEKIAEQPSEAKPVEKEEPKSTVQQTVSQQKKYYVIAGSFQNENYANKYRNKLIAEGYDAEKLPARNGMHAVSFSSFAEKQKALAELNYLTKEKGLTAWLLYY